MEASDGIVFVTAEGEILESTFCRGDSEEKRFGCRIMAEMEIGEEAKNRGSVKPARIETKG